MSNAAKEANAVKLMERAVFPPASFDMKLETLPPGQEATIIITKAMLGNGLMIETKTKVTNGINKNCANMPTITGFGDFNKVVKSVSLISKATPNMTKASVRLANHKLSESKFI